MGDGIGKYSIALLVILVFSTAQAAPLNLSKDASGWYIYTPSASSRIMYVSSTDGNDGTGTIYTTANHPDWSHPLDPTGTIYPYATIAAAYANMRNGYADWVLLKRGDTWTVTASSVFNLPTDGGGASASEPWLISAYGSSGASPIIQTGADTNAIIHQGHDLAWVVFSGIHFFSYTRDPANGSYVEDTDGNHEWSAWIYAGTNYTVQGLMFEGCKFNYFSHMFLNDSDGSMEDIWIYRTMILSQYPDASSGHAQGINTYGVELLLDECVLDHNGWLTTEDADYRKHNLYLTNTAGIVISRNIIMRGSHAGIKTTNSYVNDGITIDDNLLVDNVIAVGLNGNYCEVDGRMANLVMTNNIVSKAGTTRPYGATTAQGLKTTGVAGGTVSGNLVLPAATGSAGYAYEFTSDLSNINFSNNIAYNWGHSGVFFDTRQEDCSDTEVETVYTKTNITFSGNKTIFSDSDYVVVAESGGLAGYTISNNKYYSGIAANAFRVAGADYDVSGWSTQASATGEAYSNEIFPAPTRDVDTYMASIGETGTLAAFIAAQRAQDRYSWDSRLEADTVNDWIRAGFWLTHPPNISGGSFSGAVR